MSLAPSKPLVRTADTHCEFSAESSGPSFAEDPCVVPEVELGGFLLSFARVGSWSVAAPLIGESVVPPRVRAMFAAGAALPISHLGPEGSSTDLLNQLPVEVVFGLGLGFASKAAMAAVEAGGQIIGMQLGLGFAGGFDPMAREESLPTRRLAFALAALTFLELHGLERLFALLATAPAHASLAEAPLQGLVEITNQILVGGLGLAAPLVVAGLVANLTMAFASRAAPSLNVFSVMLALFMAVGLLVLVLTAPGFVTALQTIAEQAIHAPELLSP